MSNRESTTSMAGEKTGPESADAEAIDIVVTDASFSADRNVEFSDQENEEDRDDGNEFTWQRPKYDTTQSPYGHFKQRYNPFDIDNFDPSDDFNSQDDFDFDYDPPDDFDDQNDPAEVDHGNSLEDNDGMDDSGGWEPSDKGEDNDGQEDGGGADHRDDWKDAWNDDCYIKWSNLSSEERKVYDDLAHPYRSEYLGLLRDYNASVPLSPSAQSICRGLGVSLKFNPKTNQPFMYTNHEVDGSDVGNGEHRGHDRPTIDEVSCRLGTVEWNKYRRDDPHACGAMATPVPAHPFPFFKLPPEVRAPILQFCLRCDQPIWQRAEWSCFDYLVEHFDDLPVDTRPFAVSAQMRAEAEEAFYLVNEFTLMIKEDEDLPHYILSPPSSLRNLRHMTVFVVLRASKGVRRIKEKLKIVCSLLQQCTLLSHLRLVGFDPDVVFSELNEDDRENLEAYIKELLLPYALSLPIAIPEVLYRGSPNEDFGFHNWQRALDGH